MKTLRQIILVVFILTITANAQFSYSPEVDQIYSSVIAKMSQHNYESARNEIDNILTMNNSKKDIQKVGHFLKGYIFFIERKFSNAIPFFSSTLQLVEEIERDKNLKRRSYIILAECYSGLDNDTRAIEIYNDVLANFSDTKTRVKALIRANGLTFSSKTLTEANSYLDDVIKKYKDSKIQIAAKNLKGQNLISQENYAQAVSVYGEIISKNTNNIDGSWAKLKLGEIYLYGLNDNLKAKSIFESVVSEKPDSIIVQLAEQHLMEINSLE